MPVKIIPKRLLQSLSCFKSIRLYHVLLKSSCVKFSRISIVRRVLQRIIYTAGNKTWNVSMLIPGRSKFNYNTRVNSVPRRNSRRTKASPQPTFNRAKPCVYDASGASDDYADVVQRDSPFYIYIKSRPVASWSASPRVMTHGQKSRLPVPRALPRIGSGGHRVKYDCTLVECARKTRRRRRRRRR